MWQDCLGSVAALSNENSEIVEKYRYDVFGGPTIRDANNTIISQSSIANPYMFTSRRFDTESALYYYRARYYAYDIGRFLQTDPIGYDDGLNMYTYCGNNPINWADPMGLCKEDNKRADLMDYTSLLCGLNSRSMFRSNADMFFNSVVTPRWNRFVSTNPRVKKAWEGHYFGTGYGKRSVDYYANQIAFGGGKWYNHIHHYTGGALAALWMPESWKTTTVTLASGLAVAKPAAGSGPWLGSAGMHPAHHGLGKHIEIIIRVGKSKNLKIIAPAKKSLIYFGIK